MTLSLIFSILFIDTDETTLIVITDITGKTILVNEIKSGHNSIDVSGLSSVLLNIIGNSF